jgi:hypothetical protein
MRKAGVVSTLANASVRMTLGAAKSLQSAMFWIVVHRDPDHESCVPQCSVIRAPRAYHARAGARSVADQSACSAQFALRNA